MIRSTKIILISNQSNHLYMQCYSMYSINLNVQKVLRSGMKFFIDFELQTYEF